MNTQNSLLTLALALVIVVPVLIIILSEIIARLEGRNSVYLPFWRRLRDLFLPLLVAFIIASQMLGMTAETPSALALETAIWAVVAFTLGSLMAGIGKASADKTRWEAALPSLFRGLLRLIVIGVPVYYILSEIWGLQLNDLFAALGVGSLVIALALQDTLSSIVSGFLLTLDRPFEVGDQIVVEGKVGRVLDLNWRSVRVQINGRDIVVVPNAQLASQSIYNLTTVDASYRDELLIDFDYSESPNDCKRVLKEAALMSAHLLADPEPEAYLVSLEASAIRYQLVFYVTQYLGSIHQRKVRSDILTNIYYAARRADLTFPFPIVTIDQKVNTEPTADEVRQQILEQLENHVTFANVSKANLNLLCDHAQALIYGRDEIILANGRPSDGLYLVLSGQVGLMAGTMPEQVNIPLGAGSLFGEMVFLGSRVNAVAVRALSDVEVIYLPATVINEVLRQQPRFALNLDRLVNERQNLLAGYSAEPV